MTREEKVARAQELRAEGLLLREIAERMGAKLKTVHAWLTDPDLSRQRARRETYRGRCACGAPTTGCNGRAQAPKECLACLHRRQHEERQWKPEAIIDAIRAWFDSRGRPPVATDWHIVPEGEVVPSVNSVQREFGTWNAAIAAAGFTPFETGHYGRIGENAATWAEAARRYQAGESAAMIARHYGVTATAVLYWLAKAGVPRRTNSEAQLLRFARESEQVAA